MQVGVRRGLARLWVVLSVILVPAGAIKTFENQADVWARLDRTTIDICSSQSDRDGGKTSVSECVHQMGADQTMFQHEHISPSLYWSEVLGLMMLTDVGITALIVGAFLTIRWVYRGFRGGPPPQS